MRNEMIPHYDRNVQCIFQTWTVLTWMGFLKKGRPWGCIGFRVEGLGFRFRVRIQGDLFKTLPRG